MPREVRLTFDADVARFSVRIRGLSGSEESLLVDMVKPYWTVTNESIDADLLTIDLIRRPPAHDTPTEIVGGHRLQREDRRLLLFVDGGDVALILAIVDIVRAILKVSMVRSRAGINCHTGAVDSRGRGILFSGARGSGKTTVLRACANSGLRLVANDQCVLLPGKETVAFGFPALVAVRPEPRRTGLRLPSRPVTAGLDKHDGMMRQRYSLPALASANGTSCVRRTLVGLLVSYKQSPGPHVLRAVPADTTSWFDTAVFELSEAYGHELVALARDLLEPHLPNSGHVDDRPVMNIRHCRVTCSADMLDRLPGKLVELLEQS
jgi:hypothetical protein